MTIERTIKSGPVKEIIRFKQSHLRLRRGVRRKGSTSAKHKARNNMARLLTLSRIINVNFCSNDYLLILTYIDEPGCFEQLRKDLRSFYEQLNRISKKVGKDNVRWIAVPSNHDGETKEDVRKHIHFIIGGDGFSVDDKKLLFHGYDIENIWGKGYVKYKHMSSIKDHTGLAKYLLEQADDAPNAKAYHVSRNLKKPEVHDKTVLGSSKMSIDPGAIVLEHSINPYTDREYARIITNG